MKKGILFSLAALACISLASCGSKESTTTPEVSGLQVTVLMPDNTPAKGVQVQWCEQVCLTPVLVNDKGVAVKEDYTSGVNYNVHVLKTPAGYTYNPYELVQNDTNKVGTIKLIKLDDVTSGEGTLASPYMINTGMYSVSLAKGDIKYYAITPSKAGKLVLESFAIDWDPAIGYFGEITSNKNNLAFNDDGGNAKNFKYELEVSTESVSASKTYVFGINAKTVAEFSFKVSIE